MKTLKWTGFVALVVGLAFGWNGLFTALGHEGGVQLFNASFDVSQAVPAPASPPADALGSGVFFLNEDDLLVFQVALTGLTSSVRALQFHIASAGEVGAPVQTICGEGPAGVIGTPLVAGPCKPGTAHVMQARWAMNEAQVADLQAGRLYVNVHTEANFAPGEIRAQVEPVTP